jgi:hypothetical protein
MSKNVVLKGLNNKKVSDKIIFVLEILFGTTNTSHKMLKLTNLFYKLHRNKVLLHTV